MTSELQALQDADFGWVQSLESIWTDEGIADGGPNQDVIDKVIAEVVKLTKAPNPPGRVFLGQAGIGKTHLVGVLRQRAWAEGCWFVMLDVVGITDFWKSAALSFVTSLLQDMPQGQRQYEAVIAGIARRFKIEKEVDIAFSSPTIEPKRIVDLLVGGLMKTDMSNALKHQDVFRALALLRSHDLATVGIAHAWLQGYDADEEMRKSLGFLKPPPPAIEIVRGLCWVMGLAGPTLVAVDQIDGVLSAGGASASSDFGESVTFAAVLTGGLLDFMTVVGRGMIVLTSLLSSWEIIRRDGPAPLQQRFTSPVPLRPMQGEAFVRKLISDRLAPAYVKAGISPATATGPFTDAAIKSAAGGMTPRTILMRCDEHRRRCIAEGKLVSCDTLAEEAQEDDGKRAGGSDGLDAVFAAAVTAADLSGLIDDKDDGALGNLLRDAFDIYAKQIPPHNDYDVISKADPAQRTPPLHGRLTFVDHRANDREQHFCFRALQHSNPVALCARFRAALTASGISASIAGRKLVVVRRGRPPSGPRTRELFEAFDAAGGLVVDPSDADLRAFGALRTMRDAALAESRFDDFERWLISHKPLCATDFFKSAGLCPPPLPPRDGAAKRADEKPAPLHTEPAGSTAESIATRDHDQPHGDQGREEATLVVSDAPPLTPNTIPIGHRISADADPVSIPTNVLPRHTAIIAGAGSGKTVLLRRIVEEAALAGIPAIVIDPNNDLSRLGDAWPAAPDTFTAEDVAKAKRYRENVDVVVWTPGVHAGNPLFLSVLPDFAAIGDDPDERGQAVTMAAETLGPLAGAKNNLAKGVLSDALRHFAGKGGGTLKDMIDLLAELPEGASDIGNAEKIAAKMADELKAAIATNPLLKVSGAVLDPKLLFHGANADKTRISVINLSGLASQEAKEDFVNRLQMTLFGWIKKNPSPTGMLYVIDEAQNFVPSGRNALSKLSGVELVAQARKYGLGMIVVTQAPKGIDNKIVSNCTTQFLGKQNSPTDQTTVKEMAAGSGGKADDIGRLKVGEFYYKSEGTGKLAKIATPVCLTYHPSNPPTPEEVVARARASVK